ncbi:DUF3108 domain-containing protein [Parashewanella spongiae]|uniref:DUF3108 domain-containing protein n=1 Tax=Parashewanella spongiae TaxID=342950 RepID=A0A3A6TXK3_9GAMM|nr:DUF3108 domain-containing protein [Parashewanella spongiae]MCL1076844.1 DUF3108 domain-containing protein [Parashewanella spongiae]RJY19212.1 DUF3108 domain-containing protein [Parashewanella spongiae]
MSRIVQYLFIITLLILSSSAFATLSPLLPQTAEYRVLYGSIDLGKARYTLDKINDQFNYKFESELSLLVLSDRREVSSEFVVTNDHVNPIRFFHEREGTGSDYQAQLVFLKSQEKVYGKYKHEKLEFNYANDLYDILSVQVQLRLDLANKKEDLNYKIIKSNKISDYQFNIVGTEVININQRNYQTIKLMVERKKKKRQTLIWLAPELAYLPVKLTHSKKGKKQLEVQLLNSSFMTERDELAQSK